LATRIAKRLDSLAQGKAMWDHRPMEGASDHHDIAIHGWGMLPALLALDLLAREPESRVLLLCGDSAVGGDQVEPVVADKLAPAARDLAERCTVIRWEGYHVIQDGHITRRDEAVWLLDPVQVWLELDAHADRCSARTGCASIGDAASPSRQIDLAPLTLPQAESEIRGNDLVRELGLPILADYDSVPPGWHAHQMLPLGDDRVMVRKLPLRTSLVTAASTFESLLNALVGE
jgi:hypothetical protein